MTLKKISEWLIMVLGTIVVLNTLLIIGYEIAQMLGFGRYGEQITRAEASAAFSALYCFVLRWYITNGNEK